MPDLTTETIDRRTRNLAIYVLLAAAFVAILNETLMSIAIPVLQTDFGIPPSTAQWLTTGFLLTMAIVIPITGFLIGRFSTRQLFIGAMVVFLAGTLIGALSPVFPLVIFGRVVQASATAVMLPLLMTTVLNLVPENERGKMMGNISIVIAVAPAIGPAVSGAILSATDNNWHMLFWTMVPIVVLVGAVGAWVLPNVGERKDKKVDFPSVALSAVGFGGLVYALNLVGSGGGALEISVFGIAGAVSLFVFIRRQLALAPRNKALLDFRAFSQRSFTISVVILCAGMLSMFGLIILLPLYLADIGVSAQVMGLAMMPGALLMGLMGPIIGRLYDRVGPRPLVIPGSVLLTLGVAGLAFVGTDTPLAWVIGCHVIMMSGLGFLFTPLFSWGLGSLPKSLYADGSAIVNTLQQVFGAVGTALFVTIAGMAASAAASSSGVDVPTATEWVSGYRFAFTVGAVLSIGVIVLAFMIKPHKKQTTVLEEI